MVVNLQLCERRNMQLSSMGGILYHQLNSSEQADLHVRTLHISEPSLPSPQTTMVGGQLSTALQGIRRSAVEALYHHHPLMSSPLWWRSALRACALSETPALYDTHKSKIPTAGLYPDWFLPNSEKQTLASCQIRLPAFCSLPLKSGNQCKSDLGKRHSALATDLCFRRFFSYYRNKNLKTLLLPARAVLMHKELQESLIK